MKILQKFQIFSKIRTNILTKSRMTFCSATETREKQEFKKLVDFFLERSTYNWDDHHLQAMNTLKSLRSMKSYTSGDEQKAKEIMKNEKINLFASALMENEKKFEEFSKITLEEIEDITGLTESDFSAILNHYKYYKGLHGYIYNRKQKNDYMPEDQHQLQQLLLLERPEFLQDINREKVKKKRDEKNKKMTKKEKEKKNKREQKQYLRRIKTWQI